MDEPELVVDELGMVILVKPFKNSKFYEALDMAVKRAKERAGQVGN